MSTHCYKPGSQELGLIDGCGALKCLNLKWVKVSIEKSISVPLVHTPYALNLYDVTSYAMNSHFVDQESLRFLHYFSLR